MNSRRVPYQIYLISPKNGKFFKPTISSLTLDSTIVSMRTDRDLLVKGFKSFLYTAGVMFLAPIILYQAFKNTENVLFWPVLIVGLVLAVLAIYMGFRSVNIVMEAFFGKKPKH